MKTCFLIGHRDAPDQLYSKILAAATAYASENSDAEFIVGRYGKFDAMAMQAIRELKHCFPSVKLTILLPYLPTGPLPKNIDDSLYPPNMEKVPKYAAIVAANRYAARTCDCLIAYAVHPGSNAWNLVEYVRPRVRKKELELILLYRD